VNAHVGIDGLTTLRRIDPEDAALSAALCSLLRVSGMAAQLVDADGMMFAADGGVSFAVASINGKVPIVSLDRVTEAVAVLDTVDPLLTDVEAALGIPLDATAIGTAARGSIGVQLTRDDVSLILTVPGDHARRDEWIARAAVLPPSAPHMPVALSLNVSGPRLMITEASELASGDLLLIAQSATTTLQAPHLPAMTGAFDFSTGQFSLGQTGDLMPDDNAASDFMVPLTIKLPDRMTSAGSLSALVPGSTLPLGPLTEGMPVELRVAERLLARGELVQLGDRFAVLIEDRADINDAPIAGEGD
jgi:flagellar motor switch/type III secretory pathway protein FliN